MADLSQLTDEQLDQLAQSRGIKTPQNQPSADLSSLSDEQLNQLAESRGIAPRSTAGEVARPFLRAVKSSVVGTLGAAGDLAQEAVYAPEALARTIARAEPFNLDIQPFDYSKVNTTSPMIRQGFDKSTGGLTKPRNKTEEYVDIASEIAGGIVAPAVIARGASAVADIAVAGGKKLLQKTTGVKPELVKAFEDAGVSPRLADVSTSKPTKALQNLLEVFPGSASTIQKATQNQIDDITKQIAGITKSEGGTIQETGKTIQQGATNLKGVLEGRIEQNYNVLDKFVLTESQRQTSPKLLSAIDEWTKLKELESSLTGSVQGNAKAVSLVNADANQKLGFWRNRARQQGSSFLGASVEDAKNLNNLKRQISSQEQVISKFEKYMSPEQFQSALMTGETKISTNNLAKIINEPEVQDIAAIGAGDTSRVIARYSKIIDENGNIPYPRLKIFRSSIGKKLNSPSLGGDERGALKQIYAGLSEDMKTAVSANGGEKGLQAFNKANNAFGRYQDILGKKINPIIEAKTPEAVYSMAMSGSKQGGSNIKGIMKTLDPQQAEFVRGTITKRMGMANAGDQNATGEIFSPNKFLTEWNKISPEAKANIYTPAQVKALNNLNTAIFNIKETSKIAQKSNNLPYMNWLGLAGAVIASPLGAGQAALAVGGAKITANMMTSPRFINWLAQAPKVRPNEIPKHLKELSVIASQNQALREDILDYLESITTQQEQ